MEDHGRDLGLFRGQGVEAETKAGQFVDVKPVGVVRPVGYELIQNPSNRGNFIVRDSGKRQEYESGMRRDTQEGKPNYNLLPRDFLRRWAMHMTKAVPKYGRDNWTLANSQEELQRFEDSALRHMMMWLDGETDEDHASAICFNIAAAERVKGKLGGKK